MAPSEVSKTIWLFVVSGSLKLAARSMVDVPPEATTTLEMGVLTTGGLLAVAPAFGRPKLSCEGVLRKSRSEMTWALSPPTSMFWTVFCPATTDTSATSPPCTSVASGDALKS